MGWGRFDDAYPHHPKLLAVGPDGLALDVAAVCYSNRYGTDGWIPAPMLVALYPPIKNPRKVAAKLVEVGRWEADDGGWWIHDFTEYNPTSAEAAEKREKRARAGRKGGLKSKPPPSKREANEEANASPGASDDDRSAAEANGNPDPYPYPEQKNLSSDAASGADPVKTFGQTAVDLTRHLGNRVAANGHKIPAKGSKNAWRWFEEVDRLLRLDGADPREARSVIDWATDDEFWKANIRSAGKLREQYSALRLRMLNGHAPAQDYGEVLSDGTRRGVV